MAKFTVHVAKGARWSIESENSDKQQSISHAKNIIGRGQVDGVKVTDATGKIVYQMERQTKAMTIVPVSEAPLCQDLEDYYRFPARKTIGRLLRKFLDEQVISALELLYGYGYLRMISRADTLYYQAVSSIGNLQARAAGDKNPQKRTEELYQAFDKVTQRAKKVGEAEKYLAVVKERGIGGLVTALANEPAVRRDFFVRAGIAAYLATSREWAGKIELMLDEVDKNPGAPAIGFVDETLAELLDGSEAIRDTLGAQSDLASALITLARIAQGQNAGRPSDAPLLARLNTILVRPDMPLSNGIIVEQIIRRLNGTAALTRGGQGEEGKAFGALLNVLAGEAGLLGGPDMAKAVLSRAKLVMGSGSGLNLAQAISRSVMLYNGKAARIGFLADLCETDLVEDAAEALIENLDRLVTSLSSADELVADMDPPADARASASRLAGRLAAAPLPDQKGTEYARKLQSL